MSETPSDDPNPYRAPSTQPDARPRRPSWVGTAVIVLAIVVYGPMTVTPLVRALSGKEVGLMLGVFLSNGATFAGLVWLGRWLRKRSLRSRSADS